MFEFDRGLVSDRWFRYVDAPYDGARTSILNYLRNRVGFTKLCGSLSTARLSLHRYLSGKRRTPNEVIRKLLVLLSKEEFNRIISGIDRFGVFGLIKNNNP